MTIKTPGYSANAAGCGASACKRIVQVPLGAAFACVACGRLLHHPPFRRRRLMAIRIAARALTLLCASTGLGLGIGAWSQGEAN